MELELHHIPDEAEGPVLGIVDRALWCGDLASPLWPSWVEVPHLPYHTCITYIHTCIHTSTPYASTPTICYKYYVGTYIPYHGNTRSRCIKYISRCIQTSMLCLSLPKVCCKHYVHAYIPRHTMEVQYTTLIHIHTLHSLRTYIRTYIHPYMPYHTMSYRVGTYHIITYSTSIAYIHTCMHTSIPYHSTPDVFCKHYVHTYIHTCIPYHGNPVHYITSHGYITFVTYIHMYVRTYIRTYHIIPVH